MPLDIELHVCAKPGYFAADVEQRLLDAFSAGRLPGGGTGFFHPDRFTFGQPVYLSAVIAAAMAVPGVAYVTPVRFQRLGRNPAGEIASGRIPMARLEIARLDNDPNAPENGRLRFDVDTERLSMDNEVATERLRLLRRADRTARQCSNDPGLPALRYRVDTQPGFYARMLQSLPLARADANQPDSPRPLARLLSRSSDDPTVAFVDACACVADVLTFYQERIANEGFLRTATERRSVLELARAIGYELKPGVAASVLSELHRRRRARRARCLHARRGHASAERAAAGQAAAGVRDQRGARRARRMERARAAPGCGRPIWRSSMCTDDASARHAQGAGAARLERTAFRRTRSNLHQGLIKQGLFRLDPGLAVDQTVDAIEVGRVYFTDAATGIAGGDLLLFVAQARQRPRQARAARRSGGVRARVEARARRCRGVAGSGAAAAAAGRRVVRAVCVQAGPQLRAGRRSRPVGFTSSALAATVASQAWRERDLQGDDRHPGLERGQSREGDHRRRRAAPPVAPEAGAFAFGAKLGFFGNNAPKWAILPNSTVTPTASPTKRLGRGRHRSARSGTLTLRARSGRIPRASRSRRERLSRTRRGGRKRGSWIVFDAPEAKAEAYSVFDARETSRADYGLSGRAMALTLPTTAAMPLDRAVDAEFPVPQHAPPMWRARSSRSPTFRSTRRSAAGDTSIELDRMVLGLAIGQPIALTGERYDLPGVDAAEIASLADIVHADGRSTLVLAEGLAYSYRRSRLKISANVVHATHGESVNEVLGNGDASIANQSFILKKPPTTFLSAPTASGVMSTLEVRVERRALGRGAIAVRRRAATRRSTRPASTTTRRCRSRSATACRARACRPAR